MILLDNFWWPCFAFITPLPGRFLIPPPPHPHHKLLCTLAAAKSLQLCPTLCDPRDGNPPGCPVPGILQARTLEWVAISFSSAWKWKWGRSVVSDCSRPHGLQPTRLPCPWDFPGKSSGVGCHCLLRCTLSGPLCFTQMLTSWDSRWDFFFPPSDLFTHRYVRVELDHWDLNHSFSSRCTDHLGQGT